VRAAKLQLGDRFHGPGTPIGLAIPACAAIVLLHWFDAEGLTGIVRALPIVGSILIVGLIGQLFARTAFTMYGLVPRSQRARYALELALFRWSDPDLAGRPERHRVALAHLEVAQRSECTAELRARIDRLIRLITEENGEQADDIVGRELRSCIKSAPSHRGSPYLRRPLFPEYLTRRLPVVSATIVTAWSMFARGKPALEDAALWLTVFILVLNSLRLLSILEKRWRVHQRNCAFRTVFITDLPVDNLSNRASVEFYASVGHLLAIFVGAQDEEFHGLPWWGAETFAVSAANPTGAFEAFVDHADLVVVHTLDPTLAARVRQATLLPKERCLAVREDGATPSGFEWLDPMCFRLDPTSRIAQRDLHPARHQHFARIRPLFASYGSYFAISTVAVLFFSWRTAPLGVLLGLALLGFVFPVFLGPRRRAAVSSVELRVPKDLATSQALQPKKLQKALKRAALAASLLCWALALTRLDEHWWRSPWLWLLLVVMAQVSWPVIGAGLVAGVLQAVKWRLDWNFRIPIFRRNAFQFGYAHKAIVMTTCGRFGHVIVLQDSELGKTKTGYNEWREEAEGEWFQIFSEEKYALERALFLHDWRIQVAAELEVADFAVFDWAEEVTENMRWELEAALARLPGDRILVVYDGERDEGVPALVTSLNASSARPIRVLAATREHDDQYLWQSHDEFQKAFRETLASMLANLQLEPRPPRPPGPLSSLPLPS
jgi:hypothetical protein